MGRTEDASAPAQAWDGATSLLQNICVEEATQQHDTSTILLEDEANYKLGAPELSDEWLGVDESAPATHIVIYTEADFPHVIKHAADPEVVARKQDMHQALRWLETLKRGHIPPEAQEKEDPGDLVREVMAGCNNPEEFRAGGWTPYYEVWHALLAPHARERAAVKGLLLGIKQGIRWQLVPPATQTRMPSHAAKLKRLSTMLTRYMPALKLSKVLNTAQPQALHFPNHASAAVYPSFVREEIQKLVEVGAVVQLPDGQRPLVVNSLGVADNKAPKLRLVIDPIYPNLLMKYEQLRYEQLIDMTQYLEAGDWLTTTDEKSGYHHQALHPEMWTLLGFKHEGRHYVFTHMPFGVGPACKAYTVVKQEVYRVVRELAGARLTFLIDDVCLAESSYERAAVLSAAAMLLQRALNFTFSLPKCSPLPSRCKPFLGMLVDAEHLRFLVPQDKVVQFKDLVAQLAASPTVSNRQLARVAGKLVSFMPAVGLAPLYARALYLCRHEQPSGTQSSPALRRPCTTCSGWPATWTLGTARPGCPTGQYST
jgi:hypothetical protein